MSEKFKVTERDKIINPMWSEILPIKTGVVWCKAVNNKIKTIIWLQFAAHYQVCNCMHHLALKMLFSRLSNLTFVSLLPWSHSNLLILPQPSFTCTLNYDTAVTLLSSSVMWDQFCWLNSHYTTVTSLGLFPISQCPWALLYFWNPWP